MVEALDLLAQRSALLLGRGGVLPGPPASARLAREWDGAGMAAMARPGTDLISQTRSRLEAASANGTWGRLTLGDWSRAPWTFWLDAPPLLATHLPVLGGFRSFLRSTGRVRPLLALIEAWLDRYDPRLPGLPQAAGIIRDGLAASEDVRLRGWRALDERFRLFDAEGPRNLAARMLGAAGRPGDALREAGLAEAHRAEGGFARATLDAFLLELRAALRQRQLEPARLAAALAFLEDGARLRFPLARIAIAQALLLPWAEGAAPDRATRNAIHDFILRHLGDPRLAGGARWQGIAPAAREVFQRWLAQVSLREFLEVISDRADPNQWRYRHAFWSTVLDAGLIEDAWVLLGRRAQMEARSQFGQRIACGRLTGFAPDQSVILMRLGPLVAAEFSYSGALRAWEDDDPNAPALGRAEVSRGELTKPCLSFGTAEDPFGLWHRGSAAGTWQAQAAALIRRFTGLDLSQSDYMP